MTVLTLGKPFSSPDATLLVENQLAIGAHLFQLVVVDDDGLASDPMEATVQIVEQKLPPIVLQPPPIVTTPLTGPLAPVANPVNPVVNPIIITNKPIV